MFGLRETDAGRPSIHCSADWRLLATECGYGEDNPKEEGGGNGSPPKLHDCAALLNLMRAHASSSWTKALTTTCG